MDEDYRQKLFIQTQTRAEFIRQNGYVFKEIWECEFRKELKDSFELKEFSQKFFPRFYNNHKGVVNEAEILNGIVEGELFGSVEVDICVPATWPPGKEKEMSPFEYFHEMSPLFCTTDIPTNEIGDHMLEHIQQHRLSFKSRRLLVGGMMAQKIMIASPLLKWYLEHGLVVSRIYQVVEFAAEKCFARFEQTVTEARRNGDIDSSQNVIAELFKLIGNSAYGGVIIQKENHQQIVYCKERNEAVKVINTPQFRKIKELGNKFWEIECAKKKIILDLPIYIGFTILQYAKLRMLQFYYDCVDEYIDRKDFQYVTMDTDSAYLAISANEFLDVVRPDKKKGYMFDIYNRCSDNLSAVWFIRECCSKHKLYDRRVPGVMKEEASGDEIIALGSKTYVLRNYNNIKLSCKGVNKFRIKDPMKIYKSVLDTRQSQDGENRGFRAMNNTIFTYSQIRSAFTYFYCKRVVSSDGISTNPLLITLSPWNDIPEWYGFCDRWDPLSPHFSCTLSFEGLQFISAEHLFVYRKAQFHCDNAGCKELCDNPETSRASILHVDRKIKVKYAWREIRDDVMKEVLVLKTHCILKVSEVLRISMGRPLVFASKRGNYWGAGVSKEVLALCTREQLKGRNRLGEIWESIRETL